MDRAQVLGELARRGALPDDLRGEYEAMSGDGFLKTLPPAQADQVKALAEGRMQFPGGFALKSPYWQQMLDAVSRYDPNFDAINYNARAKTRADFTSGKSAQQVSSFNTAIAHLGQLVKDGDSLNNWSFTPVNWVKNKVAGMFGAAAPNNFAADRQAVADELARAFKGSAGTIPDIQGWEHTFSENSSPQQIHGAASRMASLLQSRIESIGDQYNRGMGTTDDPMSLLSPRAQVGMARFQQPSFESGGQAQGTMAATTHFGGKAIQFQVPINASDEDISAAGQSAILKQFPQAKFPTPVVHRGASPQLDPAAGWAVVR